MSRSLAGKVGPQVSSDWLRAILWRRGAAGKGRLWAGVADIHSSRALALSPTLCPLRPQTPRLGDESPGHTVTPVTTVQPRRVKIVPSNARWLLAPLTSARKDSVSAWRLCTWHAVLRSSARRAAASRSSGLCAPPASACCCGQGVRVSGRREPRTRPSLPPFLTTSPLLLAQGKRLPDLKIPLWLQAPTTACIQTFIQFEHMTHANRMKFKRFSKEYTVGSIIESFSPCALITQFSCFWVINSTF